jgi:hypothetical protein
LKQGFLDEMTDSLDDALAGTGLSRQLQPPSAPCRRRRWPSSRR